MPGVGETFDARICVYLTIRLRHFSQSIQDGISRRFSATEAPANVLYVQFVRILFSSHGIQDDGMRNPELVSAKRRCLNLLIYLLVIGSPEIQIMHRLYY